MKTLLICILVTAAIIYVFFQYGGLLDFDPSAEGEAHKAAIKTGWSWQQVVKDTKAPRKWQYKFYKVEEIDGKEIEVEKRSQEIDFDKQSFAERFAKGDCAEGFVFKYIYSQKVAYEVHFDANGKVEHILDLITAADLFQMPDE